MFVSNASRRPQPWLIGIFLSLAIGSATDTAHATIFTFSEMIRETTFTGSFTLREPQAGPLNVSSRAEISAFSLTVNDLAVANTGDLADFSLENNGILSSIGIVDSMLVFVEAFGNNLTVLGGPQRRIRFDGQAQELTSMFGNGAGTVTSTRRNTPASIPLVLTAAPDPDVALVPEPGTALLCMTGLLGLTGWRWRQRRRT